MPDLNKNIPNDPNFAKWGNPSLAYSKASSNETDGTPQMSQINLSM